MVIGFGFGVNSGVNIPDSCVIGSGIHSLINIAKHFHVFYFAMHRELFAECGIRRMVRCAICGVRYAVRNARYDVKIIK